jgi:adenylate cyclase
VIALELSEADLALRSGTTVEKVRRFAELGIVTPQPSAAYRQADVLRIRLVLALESSGLSSEDVGRGIAEGHLSLRFADTALQAPIGLLEGSYRAIGEELGLPPELIERANRVLGVSPSAYDAQAREDDAEIFRMAVLASGTGLSDDALVRSLRMFSHHVRKIVEFELALFRSEIEEPMLRSGLSPQQMLDLTAGLRGQLEPVTSRLISLLHRRHEEHFFFQDVVQHIESILEREGIVRPRLGKPPAIAVLDLSRQAMPLEPDGDADAGAMVRMGDIVEELTVSHGGRAEGLVGQLMTLHFAEASDALRCAVELVEKLPEAGSFPPRVGIHAGPVVVQDGEYFGKTVNVAERVADYARPREVLATEEAISAADAADLGYDEIGSVTLRGLAEPVSLYVVSG